jgi:uncharacterized protein (DUF302 family)
MRCLLTATLLFLFCSSPVFASSGLVTVKSSHNVKTTADRLESILKEKSMTVFIRINHAAGAQKVDQQLRPTELVIFGNPKVGTPLMQCSQNAAIDLPQKALIWEDEHGAVWFSYNDPAYLIERHEISGCESVVEKVTAALAKFAAMATQP